MEKHLEDRVSFPVGEHFRIVQDLSIGAVLCGFDGEISTSALRVTPLEPEAMTELP